MVSATAAHIRRSSDTWKRRLRRASPITFGLRFLIFVAAGAGLVIADRFEPLLLVIALLVAIFPRSLMVTVDIVITTALWLLTTIIDPARADLWRICAVAVLLYLVHVTAAMAAVLPYDVVLRRGALVPWALRTGLVSLLTIAFGTAVYGLPGLIGEGRDLQYASVAAIVLMVTTGILLTFLAKRRH